MVRLRKVILLWVVLLAASCAPFNSARNTVGNRGTEGATVDIPPPAPSPTLSSGPGTPQVTILSPLQIDSKGGRIYATAQVNGALKLAVLDTGDGRLLAAWDTPGQLALDADRGRLIVDRGAQGVALVNTTTGEVMASVDLPPQDAPPAPQIDSRTGLIFAFREATIYVIDPATQAIIRTQPLSITRYVCDAPSGDTSIYQTVFDPVAERLYLSFVSRTCIPWASATIVAIDPTELLEIDRREVEINYQFIAYDGNLFGTTVSRLGPTSYWRWDAEGSWHEENGDFQGAPAGMAADAERNLIYESVGETIRIIDPRDGSLAGQKVVPLLTGSRLAGHDSQHDTLYFVTETGRLYLWPAANLFDEQSPPTTAPSALPLLPVLFVTVSPRTESGHTTAAILDNDCPIEGGQLYLMTDLGGWFPGATGSSATCEGVAAVAFSPNYAQDSLIFAAVNDPPTISRTVDTGRSWAGADTPFPDGTRFNTLLPTPTYAGDQTIFTLTTAGLLYRSRDGGRGWQLLDQRLDQVALALGSDSTLRLFGSLGGRIVRSTDGGEQWTETGATPNGEILTLLAAAPAAGDEPILYAFTTGGRFARSLDGGATWNPVMETSPGAVQLAIADDLPEEQRPVFLLHDQSLTASYDGMASVWASKSADEAGRFRPTTIAVAPDFAASPLLFVGTVDGQVIRVRADALP